MSSAVLVNYQEIYQIRERRPIPSSKFDDLTAMLKKTAKDIKKGWNSFSIEHRNELRDFAYTLLEPVVGFKRFWYLIKSPFFLLFLAVTNQFESFQRCSDALEYFIDTILDCVERDDPHYQAVLSDTLEELRLNYERIPEVKAEDTRAWLRNLSDQAIREV